MQPASMNFHTFTHLYCMTRTLVEWLPLILKYFKRLNFKYNKVLVKLFQFTYPHMSRCRAKCMDSCALPQNMHKHDTVLCDKNRLFVCIQFYLCQVSIVFFQCLSGMGFKWEHFSKSRLIGPDRYPVLKFNKSISRERDVFNFSHNVTLGTVYCDEIVTWMEQQVGFCTY